MEAWGQKVAPNTTVRSAVRGDLLLPADGWREREGFILPTFSGSDPESGTSTDTGKVLFQRVDGDNYQG